MNWKIILCAAVLSAPVPAAAWNARGHMIIAAKAWDALTPGSRSAVAQLLRHNPQYEQWVAGVPGADRDRVAFIQASTWPDDIKSEARFPGYSSDRITGPDARRNTGYDDCNRHGFWHYVNLPFSPDNTPLEPTREPNIVTQIRTLAGTLVNEQASDEVKSYDLAWLVHLVGDLHQPLHATARFVASDPDGDAGGLDVEYCLKAGCAGSPLHSAGTAPLAVRRIWSRSLVSRPRWPRLTMMLPRSRILRRGRRRASRSHGAMPIVRRSGAVLGPICSPNPTG